MRILALIVALYPCFVHAQHADPHHERHPIRMSVLIGHSAVTDVESGGILWVPAWGLDADLHISDHWSVGCHSDIEIENYRINGAGGQQVELRTPIVSTLDLFYRLSDNLVVGLGPGITFEQSEWTSLWRMGMEGEVPLNDRWEFTPTVFVDHRVHGHTVWTVALGVAHYM